MKPDIKSRADIQTLIEQFYDKVKPDPVIGFIFTKVVDMHWETHIPVIIDFWETILLDNPVYNKNAMEVHYTLNKKIPLQKIHFKTWLAHFNATVDELFAGPVAELAKTRAKSIGAVMEHKMTGLNNKTSLM
ncbi:MAG: group III truncated hemoglobin [Ferruginibacter sp.]